MCEKMFHEKDFNQQEKIIKNSGFINAKKFLLKELNEVKNKNSDIALFIKKLEKVDSNFLKFEKNKKWEDYLSTTTFVKNKPKEISIYTDNLLYSTSFWVELSIYHELRHFIWLDFYEKNNEKIIINSTEFKDRELTTKITTFRYFMKKHNISISLKWIKETFLYILDEKKIEYLSENEKRELFAIYYNFIEYKNNNWNLIKIWKEKELLFYLENFVQNKGLNKLKREINVFNA